MTTSQWLLVPYYRTSTDDKGQDPMRQEAIVRPWAEREGAILLPPEVDEGTSASKVPALDRAKFLRACERARAAGADVILEVPDRFSRMDPTLAVWELVEVHRRYGVDVWFATSTRDQQRTPMGKLVTFLQLGVAHQAVEDHRLKVVSGMRRRQAAGVRFGRKPKEFSPEEWERIEAWRKPGAENLGWDSIALRINEMRGVHELTDRRKARRLSVSKSSVRRAWERRHEIGTKEGQNEMRNEPETALAGGNEVNSDGGSSE